MAFHRHQSSSTKRNSFMVIHKKLGKIYIKFSHKVICGAVGKLTWLNIRFVFTNSAVLQNQMKITLVWIFNFILRPKKLLPEKRWIFHKMVMVLWEEKHLLSNCLEVDDNDSAFSIQAILHSWAGLVIVVDLRRRNVTWLIVPPMTWFATPAFPLRDLFHVRRRPTSAPSAEFDLFGGSSASFNTLATSLSIVTGTAVFPWRRNLGMRVQAGFLAGMMIMSVGWAR